MDYLELQTEPPYLPSQFDMQQRIELREVAESYQLALSVHGPLDDVNLSSLKKEILEVSLSYTMRCLDLAVDLEAEIFLIHAGFCPADQIRMSLSQAQDAFDRSLLELAKYANERGIILGVENKQVGKDRETILYLEDHLRYVMDYHDLGVGAVFDTGHANTTRVNLADYVHKLGDSLVEIHIHDNIGSSDDHIALGTGTVPFKEILSILESNRFDGPAILELKSEEDLRSGVEFLRSLEQYSTSLLSKAPSMPET
jgi:sugar phosphate isomerase/epimerase